MNPHRTPRVLAVAGALLMATTAILAVTPAQAATPTKNHVTLTVTELPGQVRLIPGEAVKVRLSTNVTTGYSWSTKVVGDKAAVSVSKGVYQAPAGTLVGAPGTSTWTVTAKSAGKAVVQFLATPPGGGTAQVDGRLTVIVQ